MAYAIWSFHIRLVVLHGIFFARRCHLMKTKRILFYPFIRFSSVSTVNIIITRVYEIFYSLYGKFLIKLMSSSKNNVISLLPSYICLGLFVCLSVYMWAGADLTGGHSCSGRRGPWEAGPWTPSGLGGPERLNFGLQLQIPDCNLNWVYDSFKLETSNLDLRGLLLREGRGGEGRWGEGGERREEEAFLVMWARKLSALNPPLYDEHDFFSS